MRSSAGIDTMDMLDKGDGPSSFSDLVQSYFNRLAKQSYLCACSSTVPVCAFLFTSCLSRPLCKSAFIVRIERGANCLNSADQTC